MNAVTAQCESIALAVAASKKSGSSPKRDQATRNNKLTALHMLQGDTRDALSHEFQRIDRRHYCVNGISYVEMRREVAAAIEDWL